LNTSDNAIQREIARLLKALHGQGRPRVWSLIITLFGDAIVPRGGVIGLASIQEIFAQMQIEENAVRTAMSRLAKEGWLKRIKHGRQSFYKLAPEGMGQFESATQRIYAKEDKHWPGEFDLVIVKPLGSKARDTFKAKMIELGFGSPASDVYIRPACDQPIPTDDTIAMLKSQSQSNEMLRQLVDASWPIESLQAGYESILTKYKSALKGVNAATNITPMDALVLRTLLIHDWRRVVLKDVELPDALRPDDWAGERARKMVGALYHGLLEPSETQLTACFAGPNAVLPTAEPAIHQRFKGS